MQRVSTYHIHSTSEPMSHLPLSIQEVQIPSSQSAIDDLTKPERQERSSNESCLRKRSQTAQLPCIQNEHSGIPRRNASRFRVPKHLGKELHALSNLKKLSDSAFCGAVKEEGDDEAACAYQTVEFKGWGFPPPNETPVCQSSNESSNILRQRDLNLRMNSQAQIAKPNGVVLIHMKSSDTTQITDLMTADKPQRQQPLIDSSQSSYIQQPIHSGMSSTQQSQIHPIATLNSIMKLNSCLESKKVAIKSLPYSQALRSSMKSYQKFDEDPGDIIQNLKRLQEELESPEKQPARAQGFTHQSIDSKLPQCPNINAKNNTNGVSIESLPQAIVMPQNPKLKKQFIEKQMQRQYMQHVENALIQNQVLKTTESNSSFKQQNEQATRPHSQQRVRPHPTRVYMHSNQARIKVTPSHCYFQRSSQTKGDDSQKENKGIQGDQSSIIESSMHRNDFDDKKLAPYLIRSSEGLGNNGQFRMRPQLDHSHLNFSDKPNDLSVSLKCQQISTDSNASKSQNNLSNRSIQKNEFIAFQSCAAQKQQGSRTVEVLKSSIPSATVFKQQPQTKSEKPNQKEPFEQSNQRSFFNWGTLGCSQSQNEFKLAQQLQQEQSQQTHNNLLENSSSNLLMKGRRNSFMLDSQASQLHTNIYRQQNSSSSLQPQTKKNSSTLQTDFIKQHSKNVLPEIMRIVSKHVNQNSSQQDPKTPLLPINLVLLPPKIPTQSKKDIMLSHRR